MKTEKNKLMTKEEAIEKIIDFNKEKQELESKDNQIFNLIGVLKRKKLSISQDLQSVEVRIAKLMEYINKTKYTRKMKDEQLDTAYEKISKDTGLDKAIDFKNND